MADKIRAAVIGAGDFSDQHIRGYLDTKRFEIVALADLHPAAMEEKNERFGIDPPHFTDARQMLAEMRPEVVSVCTWQAGHPEFTVAAAVHRPKVILCEKPMADSVGNAERMQIACERNGVKLAIGYQRRFLPAYTLARAFVKEGRVGNVRLIQSVAGDGLPNYASHHMDMYRYLLNEEDCEWVMGNVERKTDRYERNTRIEDRAVAVFSFKGGAQALTLSDVLPTFFHGALIYGTEGTINLTTLDLQLFNSETKGRWERHAPDGMFYAVEQEGGRFEWLEGGAAQASGVADWAEGQEPYRCTGLDGFKALQMAHGVYESARLHERVMMPLQSRVDPLTLMVESGHLAPQRPGRYEIRANSLRGEEMYTDSAMGEKS